MGIDITRVDFTYFVFYLLMNSGLGPITITHVSGIGIKVVIKFFMDCNRNRNCN